MNNPIKVEDIIVVKYGWNINAYDDFRGKLQPDRLYYQNGPLLVLDRKEHERKERKKKDLAWFHVWAVDQHTRHWICVSMTSVEIFIPAVDNAST